MQLAEQLQVDGGFPLEFCEQAVKKSDGTMDGALAWVMDNMVTHSLTHITTLHQLSM
jgi:hypothetical protein